jgi:PAS domain-containing protein
LQVRKKLGLLYSLGIDPAKSRLEQRELILCNKIALLLVPITVLGIAISYSRSVDSSLIGYSAFLFFLVFVFPLNRLGQVLFTRVALSVLPPLILLIPFFLGELESSDKYHQISYAFIGLAIIPLVLFQKHSERMWLIASLLVNLCTIISFDLLMNWLNDDLMLYAVPQLVFWVIMFGAFQFLQRENSLTERNLKYSNEALLKSNLEIQTQKEEIAAQNEALNANQVKIEEQASFLKRSNNELINTKKELLNLIDKLQVAKDKLQQKEAESRSILNALNLHYLVAHYDLSGRLISVNDKVVGLFGDVKKEMLNGIRPLSGLEDKQHSHLNNLKYFKKVWNTIVEGGSKTIEIEIPLGDQNRYFSTTLAPLFDSKNKPYAVMAIGQDITELMDKNDKIDKINEELKEKVSEISQQNQLLNFQQREIFEINEKLSVQSEEIKAINESLETRVKERTLVLEEKNRQLAEYAFINSHVLRAPVSTMMGLINLIRYTNLSEEDKKIYIHLLATAKVLDNIVYRINNAIDQGFHFDRNYLEPERDFQPMK